MADYNFYEKDGVVIGTLPTGEEEVFNSIAEYNRRYDDEQALIIDGYFEAWNEFQYEYPEDYLLTA